TTCMASNNQRVDELFSVENWLKQNHQPGVISSSKSQKITADSLPEFHHGISVRILPSLITAKYIQDSETILHLIATMHQHRLLYADTSLFGKANRFRHQNQRRLLLFYQSFNACSKFIGLEIFRIIPHRHNVTRASAIGIKKQHIIIQGVSRIRLDQLISFASQHQFGLASFGFLNLEYRGRLSAEIGTIFCHRRNPPWFIG
ncbi:MAG: hypothetical protein EGP82_11920, partial [Odoribacter splanchnicus]|nr:hypothetical protein [Odoribacter splanchnicus]